MHRDLLILTELADEKLKILVEEGESSAVYCVQLKVCAKLSEWYLLHVHTIYIHIESYVRCMYVCIYGMLLNEYFLIQAQSKKLADLEEIASNNSQDLADLQQQVCLCLCMCVCMNVCACMLIGSH